MVKTKGPNPIDMHVGSRLRMRRIGLGMSQEKLATALGLTFQQVQKYEKGANRMGSSRLQHAADVLGVAAAFFFEGAGERPYQPDGSAPSPAYIDDFVTSEEGRRLAKAFMRLRPAVRRRIVDLVNEVAGESGSS
jgi:transcriptional regulator with XRE-family HTH domain